MPLGGLAQTVGIDASWLKQGQLNVGLGVGAGMASALGGYLRATPYSRYFLTNNWVLRLEGRFTYQGPRNDQYLGAGLLTQYHVLHTNRFSIFTQAGYFYGRSTYYSYPFVETPPRTYQLERQRLNATYGMIHLGLGAQYRLSKRWSLTGLAEKNLAQKVRHLPGVVFPMYTFGINFQLKY